MASHDAGVEVTCPGCSQVVLQKAMIPLLADGGTGVGYLCPPCARALMVAPSVPNGDGDVTPQGAEGPESAAKPEEDAGAEVTT